MMISMTFEQKKIIEMDRKRWMDGRETDGKRLLYHSLDADGSPWSDDYYIDQSFAIFIYSPLRI
jgi:hypothetical protein